MSISDVSFAEDAIHGACLTLGLQMDIKVIMVKDRWRWTIEYKQNPNYPDVGLNMIKLERILQEKLKRPIDLRLESESDKNKREKRNVLGGRNE